jgi:hypothetical protein
MRATAPSCTRRKTLSRLVVSCGTSCGSGARRQPVESAEKTAFGSPRTSPGAACRPADGRPSGRPGPQRLPAVPC